MLRFVAHSDFQFMTRQGYCPVIRLIGEHQGCDPAPEGEDGVHRLFATTPRHRKHVNMAIMPWKKT